MNLRSQTLYPTQDALNVVDACIHKIAPNDRALEKWHMSYASDHNVRLSHDLDLVREHFAAADAILEFGAIPLLLTAALASCNYNVVGVDIAPDRYQDTIDRLGLTVIRSNVEVDSLPFMDNSFDAVIFNELFEHLRINPIFTMSEVLRVMKPGATMMLSTPNLKSLRGVTNYICHNRSSACSSDVYAEYKKLDTLGHMGHVREYTTSEIIDFLQKIGFNVTTVIFRGSYDTVGKRLITRFIPSLRPLVSYLAIKPADPTRNRASTDI